MNGRGGGVGKNEENTIKIGKYTNDERGTIGKKEEEPEQPAEQQTPKDARLKQVPIRDARTMRCDAWMHEVLPDDDAGSGVG